MPVSPITPTSLSHRNLKDDLLLASESGADDYIAKPFYCSLLRARLEVARRIHALQEKWVAAHGELHLRVTHDELTGLWIRNSRRDLLARELDRARISGDHTGLLMLDLDRFKSLKDTYGH